MKKSAMRTKYSNDVANQCLWEKKQRIQLAPNAFAVLRHLIHHSGILVTKDELLDIVWPDTEVCDTVLKFQISELRRILKDDAPCPRFIETVHCRGYRLIGEFACEESITSSDQTGQNEPFTQYTEHAVGIPFHMYSAPS